MWERGVEERGRVEEGGRRKVGGEEGGVGV